MTIELTPEDEKLVEEKLQSGAFRSVEELIHTALVSMPTVQPSSSEQKRRAQTLSEFLMESPLAGSGISLERDKDSGRTIEL